MSEKLKRHAPPGIPLRPELQFFFTGLILSLVYSLCFFYRLYRAYDNLFVRTARGRVIPEDVTMPFYHELSGGAFTLFLIFALSMAGFIIYHYLSHYQGSKSIYLMRRLPDRWELHHRCLTLPLTGALIYLGCALFLLLVYFCIYLIVTPAQCLIPGQWPLLLHRIL